MQSLSNIRKKKLEKQIGEETISSSSTTPTASETTSTASEGSEEGSESFELSESSESRESTFSFPSVHLSVRIYYVSLTFPTNLYVIFSRCPIPINVSIYLHNTMSRSSTMHKNHPFNFDAADEAAITAVLDRSKGPNGPFYDLERVRDGVHNSIMRFNCGELYTMKHAVEYERRIGKMLVAEFVDDDVKVSQHQIHVNYGLNQSIAMLVLHNNSNHWV